MTKDPRGSMDYRFDQTNSIVIVEWNENVVMMASNCDKVRPLRIVLLGRSMQQRHLINVQKPNTCINKAYNGAIGGVNRADQNIAACIDQIQTKKNDGDPSLQMYWILSCRMQGCCLEKMEGCD